MTKTFNPYKLFVGAFIPNWLMKRHELSFGAKCCYARLCQFAGENGKCFPTQDKLTTELGAGKRTVSKYIKELVDNELIIITRKGLQQPNVYEFVWHEWITDEFENDANPDLHGRANQKMQGSAHRRESYEENQGYHKNGTLNTSESVRVRKKRKKRKLSPKNDDNPSPSMKDKVKQRANDKAPAKKNKNSSKSKYEKKANLDLIEIWNQQPHLRAHKNSQSKVYGEALKKIEHLRLGTLYKIVSQSELKNGTFANGLDSDWPKTKWKKRDIAKAIKNLNEWCKEGNYPENKDWVSKISLGDAIYNPRTGTSTLMSAFKNGVQPLFDPKQKLDDEREAAIYDKFEHYFGAVKASTKKKIIELAKDLSGQREQFRGNWRMVRDPEEYQFGNNDRIDPGSSLITVNHYLDFLKGDERFNVSGFKPRANISPLSLKTDSYPWKEFCKDYAKIYGAHPIEGPLD